MENSSGRSSWNSSTLFTLNLLPLGCRWLPPLRRGSPERCDIEFRPDDLPGPVDASRHAPAGGQCVDEEQTTSGFGVRPGGRRGSGGRPCLGAGVGQIDTQPLCSLAQRKREGEVPPGDPAVGGGVRGQLGDEDGDGLGEPHPARCAAGWFKSSYSGSEGDSCVEVALSWHKSSHSGSQDDDCVEVATCPETVHVRDSKDVTGPPVRRPAGHLDGVRRARGERRRLSSPGHGNERVSQATSPFSSVET